MCAERDPAMKNDSGYFLIFMNLIRFHTAHIAMRLIEFNRTFQILYSVCCNRSRCTVFVYDRYIGKLYVVFV